jgi:hypothetical protein
MKGAGTWPHQPQWPSRSLAVWIMLPRLCLADPAQVPAGGRTAQWQCAQLAAYWQGDTPRRKDSLRRSHSCRPLPAGAGAPSRRGKSFVSFLFFLFFLFNFAQDVTTDVQVNPRTFPHRPISLILRPQIALLRVAD